MTSTVIDIHVHIAPLGMVKPAVLASFGRSPDELARFQGVMREPKEFLKLLDAAGVERAGLINYVSELMGFTSAANEFSSTYAHGHRDRLIPFGSLDFRRCADPQKEIDYLINSLKIAAIKVHPSHQLLYPNEYLHGLRSLEVVYRRCEESGVPVMIHTGTSIFPGARNKYADPIHTEDVAVDFPKLKIILAHGGRPLWMETCFFLIRRHPNVYIDISGIPPQRLLDYFPRLEEIADKVMFGSDWPAPLVPEIGENVRRFTALTLSEAAKTAILSGTARKVFEL